MKKIITLLLATLAGLVSAPASAAFKVFACEPEWGALVQELGGTDVEVYTATTAQQDVHKIQPRPSLIAKYRQAELVVCTGAELEVGWLPPLIEKGNNPKVVPGTPGYFEAAQFVAMLEVPSRLDRSEGDVHPFGNPHIQTAPGTIALVAKGLAERLAQVDSAHAPAYRERYQQFSTRWSAAMQGWASKAKPLAGMVVISSHKSWPYLYQWLDLKEVATLEPKPGIPPSAAHLEEVLAGLKTRPARMVIYAAYQDPQPANWLSGRAGIAAVQLPYTVGGVAGTEDLFKLFDVTIDRLLEAGGKSTDKGGAP